MQDLNKTKETEKIVSSLEKLSKLRSENIINDEELNRLKSELLGESTEENRENDPQEIYDGIDFSLDKPDNDNTLTQNEIYDGIDFSLDKKEEEEKVSNKGSDIYEGIDFSLANTEEKISEKESEAKKALKYFEEKLPLYTKRDNLLMDIEQLSRLLPLPIFIMGICAAIIFYYVLIIFAEESASLSRLFIFICIFAGVFPSFIIIPNAVKISSKSKQEKEINDELYDYYNASPYKNTVSFKGSDPYIFSELTEITDSKDLFEAEKKLYNEAKNESSLSLNKQKADSSDNEELAAYSAALYVFGSDLIHE